MAYTPATSFNYQPLRLDQYGSAGGGRGQSNQGLDFARWAAQQGIELANLARAERNTQLQIQNQFQRDVFGAGQNQQQFVNRASEQQRQIQNQLAKQAASDTHFANAARTLSDSPGYMQMIEKMAADRAKRQRDSEMASVSFYGPSSRKNLTPYGYSGSPGVNRSLSYQKILR